MLPSNCASFRGEEVGIVGNAPVQAGGYADIWKATLNGRDVILESYRSYETGDNARTFRVRTGRLFTHCMV